MSVQDQASDESVLLREIVSEFLNRSSKDAAIPAHVLAALRKHFEAKTSISAQEVKAIVTTSAEVS